MKIIIMTNMCMLIDIIQKQEMKVLLVSTRSNYLLVFRMCHKCPPSHSGNEIAL